MEHIDNTSRARPDNSPGVEPVKSPVPPNATHRGNPSRTQTLPRPAHVRAKVDKASIAQVRGPIHAHVTVSPQSIPFSTSPTGRASAARAPFARASGMAAVSSTPPHGPSAPSTPVTSSDRRTPFESARARSARGPGTRPADESVGASDQSASASRARSVARAPSPRQRGGSTAAPRVWRSRSRPQLSAHATPQDDASELQPHSPLSPTAEVRSASRIGARSPPHARRQESTRPVVARVARPPIPRRATTDSQAHASPSAPHTPSSSSHTPHGLRSGASPSSMTPSSVAASPAHPFTPFAHKSSTPRGQSPQASTLPLSPDTEVEVADAKQERRLLDLEISNKSLLAINASLESTKLKQGKEIRALQRQLLLHDNAAEALAALELSDEEDSDHNPEKGHHLGHGRLPTSVLEALTKQQVELDKSHERCRHRIGYMLEEARSTIAMSADVLASDAPGKVLHASELGNSSSDGHETGSSYRFDSSSGTATAGEMSRSTTHSFSQEASRPISSAPLPEAASTGSSDEPSEEAQAALSSSAPDISLD